LEHIELPIVGEDDLYDALIARLGGRRSGGLRWWVENGGNRS